MSVLARLPEWSATVLPLVLDHLWQATVFAALALGAASLLSRGPARARHWVWVLASLKIALPSFVVLALMSRVGFDRPAVLRAVDPPQVVIDASAAIDRFATPLGAGMRAAPSAVPASSNFRWLYAVLTLVWGAGILAVAGLWWLRRRRVGKAINSGVVLDRGREVDALQRARLQAGTRRGTRLMVASGVEQPGVHGVVRSLVVLPTGMADRLNDDELDAVFLHELAHVRRWDNLTSNLHMILCCIFWFYPVAWFVDRRLLVERERTCDDEVIRLAGCPGVYVSSLLKASRFCLGRRTAGVAAASDGGLRARVERIVACRTPVALTAAHRAIVSGVIAALAIFLAGGLFGTDRAAAVGRNAPREIPAIAEDTLAPTDTASRHAGETIPTVTGGERTGTRSNGDALVDEQRPASASIPMPPSAAAEAVDRARPVEIDFEVPAGSPLLIRNATVRIVPLERTGDATDTPEELVTGPTLVLENTAAMRVVFVRVGLESSAGWNDIVGFPVAIEPRASFVLEPEWRSWSNVVRAGDTKSLRARLVGVRLDDGSVWGSFDETARPAMAPQPRIKSTTPIAATPAASPVPLRQPRSRSSGTPPLEPSAPAPDALDSRGFAPDPPGSGGTRARGLALRESPWDGRHSSAPDPRPTPRPTAAPRAFAERSSQSDASHPATPPPDVTQPAPPGPAPAARFFPSGPVSFTVEGDARAAYESLPKDSPGTTYFPAGFENPEGIPLVILGARTEADSTVKPLRADAVDPEIAVTHLPVVTFVNTTSRRITRLKLRFKACDRSHAVTAFRTDIAPHGLYDFRSPSLVDGDPRRMRVQVLGIGFDDGSLWGEFDTTIDARDPKIVVPQFIRKSDS